MILRGLLYLSIFTLSLGQFAAISKQATASIYIFDLVVGVFALYGLFYFLVIAKSLKIAKSFIFFGIFTVIGGLSLLFSSHKFSSSELLVSGFYLIRWVIYLLSALVISNMVDKNLVTRNLLFRIFVIAALFVAIAGFVQLIVLPDFETLDPSLGWDPHKNRLASTFFDPNFTGAFLVVGITLLLDNFLKWGSGAKSLFEKLPAARVFQIGVSLVLLVALILTFSRSAWGMLAVVVLVYGLLRSRLLLLAALVVAFGAYFAVPRIQTRLAGVTDPSDSAAFRLISWNNTMEIVEDNWLLGVGFNTFRFVQLDYGLLTPDTFADHAGAGSDSSLLLVLATTGVFGLMFFMLGWLEPVWLTLTRKGSYRILIVALVMGVFLESQFVNSMFFPQLMFVLLPLLV